MIKLFILSIMMAFNCYAQSTNVWSSLSLPDSTAITSAWNFVIESDNLTPEEKEYFNSLADTCRSSVFGMRLVNDVAGHVRLLNELRGLNKKIKETIDISSSLLSTNVEWNVNAEHIKFGKFLNFNVGLRSDGVVVWRPVTNINSYIWKKEQIRYTLRSD